MIDILNAKLGPTLEPISSRFLSAKKSASRARAHRGQAGPACRRVPCRVPARLYYHLAVDSIVAWRVEDGVAYLAGGSVTTPTLPCFCSVGDVTDRSSGVCPV